MPNSSSNPNFRFRKVTQISSSHCGPAVIQMLLSHLGFSVTQRRIAEAGGVTETIAKHGMRIDQMVSALARFNLPVTLWYKMHASLPDIHTLISSYWYPVGVEWQGIFSEDQEITESTGHYSIVIHIDNAKQELIMADPYRDFAHQDRIVNIATFEKRWWDQNEFPDEQVHKAYVHRDEQLFFIIAPTSAEFPESLGLVEGKNYNTINRQMVDWTK